MRRTGNVPSFSTKEFIGRKTGTTLVPAQTEKTKASQALTGYALLESVVGEANVSMRSRG